MLSCLQDLRQLFKERGWATSSDTRDGKPVLRLTGLANGQELIALLKEAQKDNPAPYIAGIANINTSASDAHEPKGCWEKIRANCTRGAGIFYALGNAFYIGSGISRNAASGKKDWGQIGTGVAFMGGDALLATVGGKDDQRQFKSLLKKLKAR